MGEAESDKPIEGPAPDLSIPDDVFPLPQKPARTPAQTVVPPEQAGSTSVAPATSIEQPGSQPPFAGALPPPPDGEPHVVVGSDTQPVSESVSTVPVSDAAPAPAEPTGPPPPEVTADTSSSVKIPEQPKVSDAATAVHPTEPESNAVSNVTSIPVITEETLPEPTQTEATDAETPLVSADGVYHGPQPTAEQSNVVPDPQSITSEVPTDSQANVTDNPNGDNPKAEEGLVDDIDKAHEMALASKEERDMAAERRQEVLAEGISDQAELDSKLANVKYADKIAAGTENWAGVLHDHPVSEEYKQAHPDINTDPRALAILEGDIKETLDMVKQLNEVIDSSPLSIGITGLDVQDVAIIMGRTIHSEELIPRTVIRLASESQADPKKYLEDWENLHNNESTTLKQLRDAYVEAFRSEYVRPHANYAHSANAVLEDIRSGRASSPNGQPPSVPTQPEQQAA